MPDGAIGGGRALGVGISSWRDRSLAPEWTRQWPLTLGQTDASSTNSQHVSQGPLMAILDFNGSLSPAQ